MSHLRHCATLALLLSACGVPPARTAPAPQPSRPAVAFPAAARVEEALAAEAPPDLAPLLPRGEVAVDAWAIQAEPAAADPVYEPEGPFEGLLDAAAAQRGVQVTRSASLRCVAQEMARFYTEHEALPAERLTRYLLAVCGSSAVGVGRAGTLGQIDPRATVALIAQQAGDEIRDQIAPVLVDGGQVGLGFHRVGSAVAVMAVVSAPKVQLAPPVPPTADGLAIVRGRLLTRADAVVGLINQGPAGVARCRVTPGFALPQIELRCPMAPGDEVALVQINTLSLGRVLTEHVGTVLVRRAEGEAAPPYAPRPVGQSALVTDPALAGATVVERLNAVRRDAGLAEVRLSTGQSAVSARVAPHLLASILQAQPRDQDVLALGLLAGWEVQAGTIRWADIVGQVVVGTDDVADWLSDTLESPGGRWVLMRPDVRAIAVGAVPVADPRSLGLVASTYAFYEDVDHAAEARRFLERVSRARASRGLPPPQPMDGLDGLWAHARAVSEGREVPSAALQAGLDAESRARRRPLRGYLLETIDLELGELPEPVLTQRQISLGVAVGHTRAEGAAWGQYAVFLVIGGG